MVKRLEDLAKRGSGHTPSKSKPEYYNGSNPTDAGYAAIANAFNTVPEPTTMAIMSVLGIGLATRAARRKKAIAA